MTAETPRPTSRLPRFYERAIEDRRAALASSAVLSRDALAQLRGDVPLPLEIADRMVENVIAIHGLPLGVALNFVIEGRDVLVPMSVEEPSVIAAASHAARMVRECGGFRGEASASVMTAQVQLDGVPEPGLAAARLARCQDELLALGDAEIPGVVARGGGCRDLEVRVVDEELGLVVVHLHVDVGDAMGANIVDTVAEATAPRIHEVLGGQLGLRILTNLPLRRLVRVRCDVDADVLGGEALADGVARASRFAERDPFRAVTHNKGIMNGIDAVALALGQDWRAIEAGAHAYAALGGRYAPLATWSRTERGLSGVLEMPLAAATVGGATNVHPGVRLALELVGATSARELALVIASAGLAANLAALRALAGEGIQRGHMRLHHRKRELEARPPEEQATSSGEPARRDGVQGESPREEGARAAGEVGS
jgi:hydroxymethylglutaryl-CoA reductase